MALRWPCRFARFTDKKYMPSLLHMTFLSFACSCVRLAALSSLTVTMGFTHAQTGERAVDDAYALNACLAAWGSQPFGSHPVYTR